PAPVGVRAGDPGARLRAPARDLRALLHPVPLVDLDLVQDAARHGVLQPAPAPLGHDGLPRGPAPVRLRALLREQRLPRGDDHGLAEFVSQYQTLWPQLMAASVLAILPIAALFVVFQRYFVAGVVASGVKG